MAKKEIDPRVLSMAAKMAVRKAEIWRERPQESREKPLVYSKDIKGCVLIADNESESK